MSTYDLESVDPAVRKQAKEVTDRSTPEQTRGAPAVRRPFDAPTMLHLQRTAGNTSVARLVGGEQDEEAASVKDVIGSGGGQPLDRSVRAEMESSLGHDFSDVRVHTDAKASESAKAVNAHAYTSGTDVVFQSGNYAPDSDAGKRMLAHELTHVVQQKSGPVSGTPAPGGIMLSDPGDSFEREADHMADKVLSGGRAEVAAAPVSGPGIQRLAAEEEEPVQGCFVQREEEQEEQAEE